MKKHHKTPKMPQSRVAAFKKRKKLRNIKKHPYGHASMYYKKCVINSTIPTVNEDNIIHIQCPWNEERVIQGTKWAPETHADKWYKEARDAAKKHICSAIKKYKEISGDLKANNRPWYMLRKKESKKMYALTVPKKMNQQEYWEALVGHKTDKWEKKNPAPIPPKKDPKNPDMFEEQDMAKYKAEFDNWKQLRDEAVERFRDFVVSMYDKLPLSGRFKESDNDYVENRVADIKDINGEGHKINDLNPEKSKLLKKAQKITNETYAKHANLVCTNLKDHKRKRGRIILPKAA